MKFNRLGKKISMKRGAARACRHRQQHPVILCTYRALPTNAIEAFPDQQFSMKHIWQLEAFAAAPKRPPDKAVERPKPWWSPGFSYTDGRSCHISLRFGCGAVAGL
jgi:hypothetical protein